MNGDDCKQCYNFNCSNMFLATFYLSEELQSSKFEKLSEESSFSIIMRNRDNRANKLYGLNRFAV